MITDLTKFVYAHEKQFETALSEIRNGRKQTHWIWYIFPQLKGLGNSVAANEYALHNIDEARDFYNHPILGKNLIKITTALLELNNNEITTIMRHPDNLKLKSSMTLFDAAIADNDIFSKVLNKYYNGKKDFRTLKMLETKSTNTPDTLSIVIPAESTSSDTTSHSQKAGTPALSTIHLETEQAIKILREKNPNGLNFVVGDTHGEYQTLISLMDKIEFNPEKDHIYFVGDYNAGGNPHLLLQYIGKYYQADFRIPGFHLIRGNHERELGPMYALENLPDIIVIKRKELSYYIAHAGMLQNVFELITSDIASSPVNSTFAYKLADNTVRYDAPFRNIIWSRRGLYSQRSRFHNWPSEDNLYRNKACIIHGHTPYGFLLNKGPGYGDKNCLLKPQHIWFSEDLQSFNIDSNIKGRYDGGPYHGLSCLCLEVLEEISNQNNGPLTINGIKNMQSFFFSQERIWGYNEITDGNIDNILHSSPKMKTISITDDKQACFL